MYIKNVISCFCDNVNNYKQKNGWRLQNICKFALSTNNLFLLFE